MKNSYIILAIMLGHLFCSTYAQIQCGSNHKAYIWNCQTVLDNWTLDDNTNYTIEYPCLWSGVTLGGTIACKLLEDDSCTVVISMNPKSAQAGVGGFTGAEIKTFVQDAMNQCQSDDQVSAHETSLTQGTLCLCNHGSASSCY